MKVAESCEVVLGERIKEVKEFKLSGAFCFALNAWPRATYNRKNPAIVSMLFRENLVSKERSI